MPISRRVARFNRSFANHLVGPLFSRLPGFGTVVHRGRRSGREYRTPVKVFRRGDDYVITLPYGPHSDWVRNVLAAGGCVLVTRGQRIRMTGPTLFVDDGRSTVPVLARRFMTRINSGKFLALTPIAENGEARRPGASAAPAVARRDWTDVSDEPGVGRGA